MNISGATPMVDAAHLIANSGIAQATDAATMLVMKKALDSSAAQSQQLIQSMPVPVEGHIDVRV